MKLKNLNSELACSVNILEENKRVDAVIWQQGALRHKIGSSVFAGLNRAPNTQTTLRWTSVAIGRIYAQLSGDVEPEVRNVSQHRQKRTQTRKLLCVMFNILWQ